MILAPSHAGPWNGVFLVLVLAFMCSIITFKNTFHKFKKPDIQIIAGMFYTIEV